MTGATDCSSHLDGTGGSASGCLGVTAPSAQARSWPGKLTLGLTLGAMLVWSATPADSSCGAVPRRPSPHAEASNAGVAQVTGPPVGPLPCRVDP